MVSPVLYRIGCWSARSQPGTGGGVPDYLAPRSQTRGQGRREAESSREESGPWAHLRLGRQSLCPPQRPAGTQPENVEGALALRVGWASDSWGPAGGTLSTAGCGPKTETRLSGYVRSRMQAGREPGGFLWEKLTLVAGLILELLCLKHGYENIANYGALITN